MKCDKHKIYKGVRYPKNQCPDCLKVYHFVQTKSNEYGKYVSITTADMKCGLAHIIAELSTVMLHGPQPRFFWLKNTLANPDAKKHFNQTKKQLGFWLKANRDDFKSIEKVLWGTFVKHWKGFNFKNNNYVVVEKEQIEDIKEDPEVIFSEEELADISQDTIYDFLNEDDDGKKEV